LITRYMVTNKLDYPSSFFYLFFSLMMVVCEAHRALWITALFFFNFFDFFDSAVKNFLWAVV
jgi:hypothetical protein